MSLGFQYTNDQCDICLKQDLLILHQKQNLPVTESQEPNTLSLIVEVLEMQTPEKDMFFLHTRPEFP